MATKPKHVAVNRKNT